jgi:hypothetical protein
MSMSYTLPPLDPAECLAALRRFRGFSQRTLATRAGLPPDRLGLLEGALLEPTALDLKQLWLPLSSSEETPHQ